MRLATTLAVAITYKYKSKSRIQQIRSFARILPGSYSPTANREVKLCPASQRQCKPCIFFEALTGKLGWIDGHTKARRELCLLGQGARSSDCLITSVSGKPSGRKYKRCNGGVWLGRTRKSDRSLQTGTIIPTGKSRQLPIFTSIAADSRNVITRVAANC